MRFSSAFLLPLAVLQQLALAAPLDAPAGNAELTSSSLSFKKRDTADLHISAYTIEEAKAKGLIPFETDDTTTKALLVRDNIPGGAHQGIRFFPSASPSNPTLTRMTINGVTLIVRAWYLSVHTMMYQLQHLEGGEFLHM